MPDQADTSSPSEPAVADPATAEPTTSPAFTMLGSDSADAAVCVDGVCSWPGADTADRTSDDPA